MQEDISLDGVGAGGERMVLSWLGYPVPSSIERHPAFTTAETTGCAGPGMPECADSCDHSSSERCHGSEDDPMGNTGANEMGSTSTVSV